MLSRTRVRPPDKFAALGKKFFVASHGAIVYHVFSGSGDASRAPARPGRGKLSSRPRGRGMGFIMTASKFFTIAETYTGDVYVDVRIKNNGAGEFTIYLIDANEEKGFRVYTSNGNQSIRRGLLDAKDALVTSAEEFAAEKDYESARLCNEAADVLFVAFANAVYHDAGNYPTAAAWMQAVGTSNAPAWRTLGGWIIR